MAQALLGKAVSETATLRLEGDEAQYEIVNIEVAEF
jgi:transcription elongation GreA/GreB family factor